MSGMLRGRLGRGTAAPTRPRGGPAPRSNFVRLVTIVARRDYLRTVARRGFIFGTLLLPLGIGALLILSSFLSTSSLGNGGGANGAGPMVVVNESSLELVVDPQTQGNIQLAARPDAVSRLTAGSIKEFYLIPSTYPASATVQRLESSTQGAGLDSLQRQEAQEQELSTVLRNSLLIQANISPEIATRLIVPAVVASTDLAGQPVSPASVVAGFILPYVFTLLFVMSIFITSGYLLQSVTEEKENRVVEIVLSSIPALPLMAGKILGLGAAGLTQVVVWVATALIALPILNAQFTTDIQIAPITLVLAVIYFALGYIAYGAIFAAVGALAPGSREAQQYSSFFGFFAVAPLIFSAVFLTDLNSPIVWILTVIPLTTPATMLEVLTLSPSTPWFQVGLSLVVLIAFVGVAMLASARIFRATLLLYGVRPGLRQIVGAVFARG